MHCWFEEGVSPNCEEVDKRRAEKDPRAGTDLDWVHWVLGIKISGIDTGDGVEGSNECGENERVGEHG